MYDRLLNLIQNRLIWLRKYSSCLCLILTGCFIAYYVPFIAMRSGDSSSLLLYSYDEVSFLPYLVKFSSMLMNFETDYLAAFKLKWSYGLLFYIIYSPVCILLNGASLFGAPLVACRFLSLFFVALTLVLCFVFSRVLHGRNSLWTLVIFVFCAVMPGVIIPHKLLSPEALSNFLLLASIVIAVYFSDSSYHKKAFLSDTFPLTSYEVALVIIYSAAVSIKLNGLMFLPLIGGQWFLGRSDFSKRSIIRAASWLVVIFLFCFFVFNFSLIFSSDVRSNYFNWIIAQANRIPNSGWTTDYESIAKHMRNWFYAAHYSIEKRLAPPVVWLILCVSWISVVIIRGFDRKYIAAIRLGSLFLGAILPVVYVIITGRPYWDWYLVPSALILAQGLPFVKETLGCFFSSLLRWGNVEPCNQSKIVHVMVLVCTSCFVLYLFSSVSKANKSMYLQRANEHVSVLFRDKEIARYTAINALKAASELNNSSKYNLLIGGARAPLAEYKDNFNDSFPYNSPDKVHVTAVQDSLFLAIVKQMNPDLATFRSRDKELLYQIDAFVAGAKQYRVLYKSPIYRVIKKVVPIKIVTTLPIQFTGEKSYQYHFDPTTLGAKIRFEMMLYSDETILPRNKKYSESFPPMPLLAGPLAIYQPTYDEYVFLVKSKKGEQLIDKTVRFKFIPERWYKVEFQFDLVKKKVSIIVNDFLYQTIDNAYVDFSKRCRLVIGKGHAQRYWRGKLLYFRIKNEDKTLDNISRSSCGNFPDFFSQK